MNLPNPVKIKIVRMVSSDVLVKFMETDETLEMNPNVLVRRIEEGSYELAEATKKSWRNTTPAAPADEFSEPDLTSYFHSNMQVAGQ